MRQRLPGDRYRPAGRRCGKTLKKLFNEAEIPLEERERLPVLCDEAGILQVAGFVCDERAAVEDPPGRSAVFSRRSRSGGSGNSMSDWRNPAGKGYFGEGMD